MAFALQINAAFKKSAPAKKTPVKKTVQKKSAPTPKTSRRAPDQVWYPNAEPPAWLDGSMPGDRGFDPFGLSKPVEYLQFDLDKLDGSAAKNPSGVVIGKLKKADNKPTERTIVPFNEAFDINRFRECELLHSRWAMLGVLGVIVGEATTGVAWQDAGKVELEQTQYLGFNLWGEGSNLAALTAIEVLLVGTLEFYRSAELDQEKRCYPGGAFDPLGLASKDAEETFRLKTAELKHGRLAMVAMFGVAQQALNNGEGALEALTSLGK
jgi:light-harvesting complex II chlorophyll a/b binding protein 4